MAEKTSCALVVGGGSGIGRATALRFASGGVPTLVADLNFDNARLVARQHANITVAGDRAWDATDPGACIDLLAVASAGSRLHTVVSTVGWTDITPFLDETPDYWRRIVDVNLMSNVYLAAAAGRALQKSGGGSIVVTSSEAGKVGMSGETVYAATKAGVIGLVKSLAREFATYGIRVNAVAPGITATPLLQSQGDDDFISRAVRGIPMRRVGKPEEIAEAIHFLASDAASYITGQTLAVGGGLTMGS